MRLTRRVCGGVAGARLRRAPAAHSWRERVSDEGLISSQRASRVLRGRGRGGDAEGGAGWGSPGVRECGGESLRTIRQYISSVYSFECARELGYVL